MTTPPPEGGTDKHRDNWVPVPLTLDAYDADAKIYVIEFSAPKQLLTNPQFEAMVHDELLRNADRRGLMVEGQIVVTTRDGGTPRAVAPSEPSDAGTLDVLAHPEKERAVAEAQGVVEEAGGFKMSEAERAYRERMRRDLRDTAQEALGFVAGQVDGRPLPDGRRMQVDRDAFMAGFYGGPVCSSPPPPSDVMTVRVEAFIGLVLDATAEEPQAPGQSPDSLADALDGLVVPDDVSSLTDEDRPE